MTRLFLVNSNFGFFKSSAALLQRASTVPVAWFFSQSEGQDGHTSRKTVWLLAELVGGGQLTEWYGRMEFNMLNIDGVFVSQGAYFKNDKWVSILTNWLVTYNYWSRQFWSDKLFKNLGVFCLPNLDPKKIMSDKKILCTYLYWYHFISSYRILGSRQPSMRLSCSFHAPFL